MQKKVLLIEDDIALQKAAVEALKGEGLDVKASVDAEEGMKLVEDFRPDLILLDIILPGKNGLEFMKELKANADFAKIPVVILSNLGDEQEIQQSKNLGAVDYLIKADYDLKRVAEIVLKYLQD